MLYERATNDVADVESANGDEKSWWYMMAAGWRRGDDLECVLNVTCASDSCRCFHF